MESSSAVMRHSLVSRGLMSQGAREGRDRSEGALWGQPSKPGMLRDQAQPELRIHQPLEENPRSWAVMGASPWVSHPPAGKDT